ncbi:MAG TPA: hypothetical protein VIU61_04530, partial [Kofleriaceae bacterium]
GPAGPDRAVAFTAENTIYIVDLTTPDHVEESPVLLGDYERISMSPETGQVVVPDRGGIALLDPIARHKWMIAMPGWVLDRPVIAPDGKHVLVRALPSADNPHVKPSLLAWSLVVPDSAAETAKWVESMTNAILDPDSPGGLGWQ